MGFWLGESLRLLKTIPEHVGFVMNIYRGVVHISAARLGGGAPPLFVRVPTKKRNYTKNAGPVALAAMEEYSGAYMRLLHNVFGVN